MKHLGLRVFVSKRCGNAFPTQSSSLLVLLYSYIIGSRSGTSFNFLPLKIIPSGFFRKQHIWLVFWGPYSWTCTSLGGSTWNFQAAIRLWGNWTVGIQQFTDYPDFQSFPQLPWSTLWIVWSFKTLSSSERTRITGGEPTMWIKTGFDHLKNPFEITSVWWILKKKQLCVGLMFCCHVIKFHWCHNTPQQKMQ